MSGIDTLPAGDDGIGVTYTATTRWTDLMDEGVAPRPLLTSRLVNRAIARILLV